MFLPTESGTKITKTVIYGDLGSTNNAATLALLYKETGDSDLLLHLGDFAYNLMDDEG
jgi:3',5'-cyclic AMP phosphodiesterase CpdA